MRQIQYKINVMLIKNLMQKTMSFAIHFLSLSTISLLVNIKRLFGIKVKKKKTTFKKFEDTFLSITFRKEINKRKLFTICSTNPGECNISRLKPENLYIRKQNLNP